MKRSKTQPKTQLKTTTKRKKNPPPKRELHCVNVVPDYAEDDYWRGEYAPWFVAHLDPNELTSQRLEERAAEFRATNAGHLLAPVDGLAPFMDWLERHGYRVLHTAEEQPIVLVDVATTVECHPRF